MINDNEHKIDNFINNKTGKNWKDIKSRMLDYAKTAKEIFLKDNTEDDYNNIIETVRRQIDEFSAATLREEIDKYLQVKPDEKIVFIFDEASEAINQGKFSLLDLEGVSEALSSLGNKVWTIAIAQEKLDDVINNSNVSKAQLTKVTDRFKTKIHLEATEVDQIIKSRLLKKNERGIELLKEHFNAHSGQIADHSSLIGSGITKTDNEESYLTYYPFYKYQFDLMQNFLFGTKGYASTKVAARGMIITTFDILRKEIGNTELFKTVSGWQIAKEAQPSPPVTLVNRYDNAQRILRENNYKISGRKLLETINFLTEAEVTPANTENIIKSFINEPDEYHKVKSEIEKALEDLVEAKMLLQSNGTYRITSDIEQRLLDEMNGYLVQGFVKKKKFVESLKRSDLINSIARINDNGLTFDFYITTDNDDELTSPRDKSLKFKVKSIYNFSDNRANDIETLKVQHQNDKDLIWLVPDNARFTEIDKLIDEIEKITYLEQKYTNPDSEEGKILQQFSTVKSEKQNRVEQLIEDALQNGDLIYLFNTYKLTADHAVPFIQSQQKELLRNVYTKRLESQLSDDVAKAIIKETNDTRLHTYFHGNDFAFFDEQGNFIGENLKVSEEILYKIRNTFVDGKTLELELEKPPTGFSFGTVISTVAALMRAGKVNARYNGEDKFSWRDAGVVQIFSAAREFRKASFKAVSKSLPLQQKQELVQFMLDIGADKYIGRKIDYNTNDFELANAIRDLAKHFADKIGTLESSERDFNKLFPDAGKDKAFFGDFTGPVSESNYIDKANDFLAKKQEYLDAFKRTLKIEKFIRNKLPNVKSWKQFVEAVEDELKKAAKTDSEIQSLIVEFNQLYEQNIVSQYSALQQISQKIKDRYHNLFKEAMEICAKKYSEIGQIAQDLIAEIDSLPKDLNKEARQQAETIKQYAQQRLRSDIALDFNVKDKISRFTYSEVLSFIDLYDSQKSKLEILKAGLVRKTPEEPTNGGQPKPKIITSKLPARKMKVSKFKSWLSAELQKLAIANDDDEVRIEY